MPEYLELNQIATFQGKPVWWGSDIGLKSQVAGPKIPAATCSCCGNTVSCYNRTLTANKVRLFLRLYALRVANGPEHFANTRDLQLGHGVGGELAKLRFWGLVEPSPERGFWRVTSLGVRWYLNYLTVPFIAREVLSEVQDYVGPYITLPIALGDRFDLERESNIERWDT
jgi:hypothetical protein